MEQDLNEQRKKAFNKAMEQVYAGCVFDIDGTLTNWGEETIPAFAHAKLAEVAMKVPLAVCTGRSLNHALEAIAPVFTKCSDPKYCQSNWFFSCDNGGIGYAYNPEKNSYDQLYRVAYPYPESQRESIFSKLKEALQGKLINAEMNEISFVYTPANRFNTDAGAVIKATREIAQIIIDTLPLLDPKGALRVGEAGTGVNVYPYAADKENGVKAFAKYVHEKYGFNIHENDKELAVIGDQPQPYGNDNYFLNGNFGTPFTVGELHPENVYPLPVFDLTGAILKGPEATIYLLNNLKFRT